MTQEGFASTPPPTEPFKPSDFQGALAIAVVHKYTPGVATQYGARNTVDASVVLIDPQTGQTLREFIGASLWNVKLVGQLMGLIGRYTLGRISLGVAAKPGQSPPVILADPSEADKQAAQRWMQMHPGRIEELQELGMRIADAPRQEYQQPAQQPQQQYGYQQPAPQQQYQQGPGQFQPGPAGNPGGYGPPPPAGGYVPPAGPPPGQYQQPQPPAYAPPPAQQQPAYANAYAPPPQPENHPVYNAIPGAMPPPPPVTNSEQPPY